MLGRQWLYKLSGWLARKIVPWLPRFLIYNRLNPWGKQREMPEMPKQSFRALLAKRQRKNEEPHEQS